MRWGLILLSSLLVVQARTVLDNERQEVVLNDDASVCDVCEENVVPIRKGPGTENLASTCNMRVEYGVDEAGCKKATAYCTGYYWTGLTSEQIDVNGNKWTHIYIWVGELVDEQEVVTGSISVSCLKKYNGWKTLNVSCATFREIENAPLCAGEETSPNCDKNSVLRSPMLSSSLAENGGNSLDNTDSNAGLSASSVCGKCGPLVVPPPDSHYSISTGSKLQPSCNVHVEYSTDENGCEQATVTCIGRHSVMAFKNLELTPTVGHTNETTGLTSASMTVPCTQDGWQLSSYFCMVQEEVENAIPCPSQEMSADGERHQRSVQAVDNSVNPAVTLHFEKTADSPIN